jgi:hypothetical protein
MIIKSEDFELEVSIGTDVYFASRLLGQIFKKWDDLEDNEKVILEILQKRIEKVILESKKILFAKEIADKLQILKEYNVQ